MPTKTVSSIQPLFNLSRQASEQVLSLDNLSINTIRTLSIDAVQQANSGHPGTPMALAPVSAMRHEFGGHVELTANKIVSARR
jgi:hypothetical protein